MQEREAAANRSKQFAENARAFGKAVEEKGLSEDDVFALLEDAREEVFQEYYGTID